jgi:hypothetical protein
LKVVVGVDVEMIRLGDESEARAVLITVIEVDEA